MQEFVAISSTEQKNNELTRGPAIPWIPGSPRSPLRKSLSKIITLQSSFVFFYIKPHLLG